MINTNIQNLILLCIILVSFYIFIKYINDTFNILDGFNDKQDINNKGLNRCDAIIYINLENREDRKKLIKEEMDKMGIPENKIHKISGVYIPKNGHKGCVQSHILALQMAKMNDWETTLILEDDAELNVSQDEFKNKLNQIFNYLNGKDWDVIMIGKCNTVEKGNHNDIIKLKSATCGTGYIVNKKYYNKILDLFIDCNNHMTIDKWGKTNDFEPYALDQKWSVLQKKDNWYGFKKDLLKQRNVWSTTNDKGNKLENFENYGKNQDIELSPVLNDEDKINLKKGQKIMTNMLYEFNRICRENNIKYWCIGGTLIGAMRHSGWVPWDGDIDIGMLKDDYNKFKNIIDKELPSNMWFQDKNKDKYYKSDIIKIRDLNSCYIEYTENGGTQYHNGLQIDIFIFEKKNNTKITGLYPVCGTPDKNKRDYDDIFPLKELKFENIYVYVPNKFQKISKELWIDYPPIMIDIEKRRPHEGKIDPNKTCDFHKIKYPDLILKNNN